MQKTESCMLFSVSNMCFSLYNVVFPQPLAERQIQEKTSKQGVLARLLRPFRRVIYSILRLSRALVSLKRRYQQPLKSLLFRQLGCLLVHMAISISVSQ